MWTITGLTLRDYFAAATMQGLLASGDFDLEKLVDTKAVGLVELADLIADAMIARREQETAPIAGSDQGGGTDGASDAPGTTQ